jgi:hypothetical protein
MRAPAPGHRDPGDPGALLRLARDRMTALAEQAPPALCSTPEARAGLRNLLLWAFPHLYARTPVQARMRAQAGGCEFKIRPADLHDDGRAHNFAIMVKADFERAHFDDEAPQLTPGETFGFAAVFCDAAGARLGPAAVAVLPAGEGVHWPPPLTFLPGLDTVCNVLYHAIDRVPLEAFGGTEPQRDTFRTILFERILPNVYERDDGAGSAFVVTFRPSGDPSDPNQRARSTVRVLGPEHRADRPVLFDGVAPGDSFAMVLEFEGHGISQYVLPCMTEWPTEWVAAWLRERPPNDACRRCGSTGKVKKCSSCMAVRYCSSACQLADWRRHKKECVMLTGTREPTEPRERDASTARA